MISRWCILSCRNSIISIHTSGHQSISPTFNVWNPPYRRGWRCGILPWPMTLHHRNLGAWKIPICSIRNAPSNLCLDHPFLSLESSCWTRKNTLNSCGWVYMNLWRWIVLGPFPGRKQPFPHSKTTLWKDRSIVKSLHRWRGSAAVDTIAGLTNLNLHCWEPANAQSELRSTSPGVGMTQKTEGTATLRVPFKANALRVSIWAAPVSPKP